MQELDLARPLSLGPATYLEFATLGETEMGILPRFWAYGPEREALCERLETDPDVEAVSQQTECDDRVQYSVRWDTDLTGDLAHFVETIHAHDAIVLFGRADQTFWRCLLQFPSKPSLLDFFANYELDSLTIEHHSPQQAHVFVSGVERRTSTSDD
ncbi:hypothetical protein [Halomicrococcus sp. NG-SE-24]|uniref:hypothetical protein n=1 Tax=Halomicrococcus sp. NG-SE-24 TaxID=3436928 RepID=UPI003D975723